MPPLRRASIDDDDNAPEAPEAMLISAYLTTGAFTPHRNSVTDDDIVAWKPLWELCTDYQEKAGKAPPLSLVKTKFPEFRVLPDLDPAWAAQQVIDAAVSRDMRGGIHATLKALNDADLKTAYTELEKVRRPRGFRREPTDVFDHTVITDRFHIPRIEVPYPSLMKASEGGIAPGELWYIAARFAQGKSWEAVGYGACAAKAGYNVGILSCEMPAAQVGMRMLRRLAGRDHETHRMLSSEDEVQRKLAADYLHGQTKGQIRIFDPSHGRINTVAAVHDLCEEFDFVIIDHVGLMQDATNKRAVEDWRVMGGISNQLREVTLETDTAVLGVAQINREGAKTAQWSPPKADHLSQSDFLGMDADAIVTLKRPTDGGRVLVHRTAKMREAPQVKWYTRFEPGRGQFAEITRELAYDLNMEDEADNPDE